MRFGIQALNCSTIPAPRIPRICEWRYRRWSMLLPDAGRHRQGLVLRLVNTAVKRHVVAVKNHLELADVLRRVPHRVRKKVVRGLRSVKSLQRPTERAISQSLPIVAEPRRCQFAVKPDIGAGLHVLRRRGVEILVKVLFAVLGVLQKRLKYLENMVRVTVYGAVAIGDR